VAEPKGFLSVVTAVQRTAIYGENMKGENKVDEQEIGELIETDPQISETEETEMAWKVAEDVLSIVLDALNSSVSGVCITNIDGRIVYVNLAFLNMFQYEEQSEVLGRNAADLFDTKEIDRFSDLKALVDEAKGETEEFIARRGDTTTFPVEVSSSSVTDREGNIIGRMASFVDITERKRAWERLEDEKLQAVLETAGAVCHEFGQPMQVISLCCESLIDELPQNNRLRGHVAKIQTRIEEMAGLLEKLTRITKYETKDYPGNVDIIDIDKAALR
jgi:PAS domain S-box-containing protein